jgi:hypothetical protein
MGMARAIQNKDCDKELGSFCKIFLGCDFNNQPHLVIPTSRADKPRLGSFIDDFWAPSLDYTLGTLVTFDTQ